ncbi:hypothetical protein BDY19DRAFT_972215 [Irpex rosettiformis]|uniref:Uncharacterized protein n=1 Tax=Irpex rosettiformis TaxID=378272 RepID=A0ACB8TQM8_9APHY|nr:hypothetical protein BDY19DRAFT_972215 [Irpex rosettiformis]
MLSPRQRRLSMYKLWMLVMISATGTGSFIVTEFSVSFLWKIYFRCSIHTSSHKSLNPRENGTRTNPISMLSPSSSLSHRSTASLSLESLMRWITHHSQLKKGYSSSILQWRSTA